MILLGLSRSQAGTSNQPFTYTGELLDNEIGMYHLRNRNYDPLTGTFLSKDYISGSMMHPQTWNSYIYAYGNPVNLIDPSGLWGISPRI